MTFTHCSNCATELPPGALSCPACGVLVHAEHLKQLASDADSATREGDLLRAREQWESALQLLPAHSQQFEAVRNRIAGLTRQIESTEGKPRTTAGDAPWWRRGAVGLVTIGVLLLSKAKFLLLGLTKISTFTSMFAFFAVYWSIHGWPLALGIVLGIYIHEMGHVAMLRRLGIAAGAPLFIPGVGAVVMLKQRISDPLVDARIGLAGPVWGLGAAFAAFIVYIVTRVPVWLAIAELTALLNLFNLIPIWQLDGSRGFHVLARWERWAVVAAIAVVLLLTGQRLLFIVGLVAAWRAFQQETGPGDAGVLATFVGLVVALAWLARGVS